MGVSNQHNDYYESLFKRTTASYRAKCDRENGKKTLAKGSLNTEPSCSGRAAAENQQKVLRERNNGGRSDSSYDILTSVSSAKSPDEKNVVKSITDKKSLKSMTKKMLAQLLSEKYSEEFVERNQKRSFEEKSPIESVIEQILKEKLNKLRYPFRQKQSMNFSEAGTLRSTVEDIVTQVLKERFPNIQIENKKTDLDEAQNLHQALNQKLTLSYNQDNELSREPVTYYNNKRPLDTQLLIQELLSPEKDQNNKCSNKHLKQTKTGKENSKSSPKHCGVKRLQRSPRKKPEWQDPSLHDKVLDKPVKAIRAQSPTVSTSVRSGRSVLIRRAKSSNRKPISDPVALYQYYKTQWEHFRNQIPGENPHDRLRWHVRQRLLDPE